jgi:Ca2+-binding RTX toxin-like protein
MLTAQLPVRRTSTIVTRLWNASLFTSNTHGLDFVFTPQLARNDSQLQRLVTGGGADELRGGIGNDWIAGQTGADTLWGGTGNDMLYGDDAQPMAAADEGDDTVYGDAGNDQLFGGGGNDRLYGGADNDLLTGDGVGQTGDDLAGWRGRQRYAARRTG